MIRLFIQLYSGMLLALLSAALFNVWLLNNPINSMEEKELKSRMIYAAQTVVNRIRKTEEAQWNSVVNRYMEYFDDLVLHWRPLDDPQLTESQRTYLEWGKPVTLASKDHEPQVLLRLPNTKTVIGVAQRRPLDNLYSKEILVAGGGALAIIGAVGFLMAFIIVKRLETLQSVALKLGEGNWSARADDRRSDAIGQLARSFNKMAQQIEMLIDEKNALLQEQRELFQAVVHEFRKPMSQLSFAVHMLSDRRLSASNSKFQLYLDRSMGDLNSLLSEVLRYSRIQPGTPLLSMKPTNIASIIEPIVSQQEKISSELEIYVDEYSDNSLIATIDPYYFRRAVFNLISNAVRYARHQVRVRWGLSDKCFYVVVEDDGEGIPERDRTRIFKPFTRITSKQSSNSCGMGLGLAIVDRIAEKHQGTVLVDDSPIGGARFQLRWPVYIRKTS